ncbi:MAG: M48 family metallopeptidase [Rhodospirillaceae bacterium]|jgi:predicted metal-dependent hydrolase|nr:M48 family metallopeptidase [Rhodospirillales bacterium]MBT3907759.1 M48 family metallopeptidase [Rhodospirillaceae bacterium]MBT4700118.1 M48 family metallopeptidase [Rhodospirillaceae bacterium]MBT5035153.1 M48 family metallopeptidase [Rhodospirillaceae bacterium]MBT6220182.1 M48 family metallopeptidase [Rhodospirillaceae bacterium]
MGGQSPTFLDLGGRAVPLRFRRVANARRLILRIDRENDGAVVTLPPRVSQAEGKALAEEKADWILSRLDALPRRVPFESGQRVPYLGEEHLIRHRQDVRGVVWLEADEIHVAGRPEYLLRRITDWFKREARREIIDLVETKSAQINKPHGKITIRDTRSRWGSCSSNGNLSFCWRLIMAPEWVLDYVVAHEVAHLLHHDHSPRFWNAVEGLTDQTEQAKKWLLQNGEGLHRYG